MADQHSRVAAVADLKRRLTEACDTGFALAIHIRYTRPSLLYRTYDQGWIDHYSEKGFMLSDPVVHWGLSNIGSVQWDDLAGQDPEGVLRDARAFGLQNGWTYAVGPSTSRTIAGLTKSGADFDAASREAIIAMVNSIHDLTEGFEQFPQSIQDGLRGLA